MTDPDESGAVVLEIEGSLDLHTFAPREIPEVVEAYLEAARAAGLREVRLIHGRGQGVQRARVHSVLRRLAAVEAATEAPAELGGWGATVVTLRAADTDTEPATG